jgi:kinesin family protein 18/19
MADLFQRIEDRKDEWNVEVMVTFLEIYNEEIRDLLAEPGSHVSRGGLSIREDKSVKVVGLNELRPRTAEEVKEIVLQGNLRRTQSPTHANETSSRSHAVLQVHVTQSPRTANVTEQRTMATLSIIDLAGSERAAATSNMGQRMVEGANINKSLLALGNCINALCESGGAIRHVPYRNSKLTRLLKFSLGGNCKTVMIVCVAPTSNHFDDTHNTLLYADRATKIKTKVVTRNVVNVDRHVGRYVEAINRLNIEVAELKAKLAGKVSTEADIMKRKKAEADAEVERARNDMKVKTEQTQASIVDGATCSGKISVAQAKLRAIRARLAEIDLRASSSGPLSPDLEAERALLQALAGPEEQAVGPESALHIRLQRSTNSGNMFEATLRAVTERRSEKLAEFSVDNVKLDAQWRRADIERAKAEAERDAMKGAIEAQSEMVVNLVGIVGRCTVMIGEASRSLRSAVEDGREGMEGTVRAMAASLRTLAEKNDEAFISLVGHSTAGYAVADQPASIDSFKGHSTRFTPRVSSGPAVLQQTKASRRSSNYGLSVGSPGGRSIRSPRKSLRSSLASQPYRRVSSDKDKKKSVQWRDQAGRGDLDDGGPKPVITIIPPEGSSGEDVQRNPAFGGSESEWEDEKTDDSVSFLPTPQPLRSSTSSQSANVKRPRASRLDPTFLKLKGSTLGSLPEDDENTSPNKRGTPLLDRNVNQLLSPEDSVSPKQSDSLHVPKRDGYRQGSPGRRATSTATRVAGMSSKSSRRRSNIGPLRNEKSHRRSSLTPLNSERKTSGSAPRRVPVRSEADLSMRRSPAKRSKRLSLLGSSMSRSTGRKPAILSGSLSPANLTMSVGMSSVAGLGSGGMMDPNSSPDMSFKGSSKRGWR